MVDYTDSSSLRYRGRKVKITKTRNGIIEILDQANSFRAAFDSKCLQQFMQLLYMVASNSSDIRKHTWQTESVPLYYDEQPITVQLFGSYYFRANSIRCDRASFILQCLEKRFKTTIKKDKDYYKNCTVKYLKTLLKVG